MRRIMATMRICFMLVGIACAPRGPVMAETPVVRESRGIQWMEDLDKAWAVARRNDRLLMLYITLDGCAHCEKMQQTTYRDRQVTALVRRRFVAAKLTADEHQEVLKKLGVDYYPTTLIISKDAKVLDAIRGYEQPNRFARRLLAVLDRKI